MNGVVNEVLAPASPTGEELERLLRYWTERLAGAPPPLVLPSDHIQPDQQSYREEKYHFRVLSDVHAGLRALAQDAGTTLFTTLLAAFDVLLARYSGQTDVCVGTWVAVPTRDTVTQAVDEVDTLVLRTDVGGNPSFRALLAQVRERTLADLEHKDLPFDQLVETLHSVRSPANGSLVPVMFVLECTPLRSNPPVSSDRGGFTFDLMLRLTETPEGLEGVVEYDAGLFEAATSQRLAGHYLTLLAGIVSDSRQRIHELPMLTAEERRQLLVEWNDAEFPVPAIRCMHQLFEQQTARTPDAVALIFEDVQLTYRQLDRRANQLARYLQGLGAAPDVLIGLHVERSVEMIVAILGVLKAGAACVPLDPTYPAERLASIIEDTAMPLLLTQQHLMSWPSAHSSRIVYLDGHVDEIAAQGSESVQSDVKPENLAFVFYTSGSTGQPKGVMWPHDAACHGVWGQYGCLSLGHGTRVLQVAPLSFSVCVWEIFTALWSGATLVVARRDDIQPGLPLVRLLQRQEISMALLVPSTLAVLPNATLPALETLVVGGEACPLELMRRWAPGRRLANVYGSTEICTGGVWWQAPSNARESLLGRPMPNRRVYVLDAYMQPVPVGLVGEMYFGGLGLARGYLNRPELTVERFMPDPFSDRPGARLYRTGDLVRYRADGNLVYVGRADQQIKIRGQRVELDEIRSVLLTHPMVEDCAVIKHEPAVGSPRLVAYFAARQEQRPTSKDLREYLLQKLPSFMVPAQYVLVAALPLTPNGKLDLLALPPPGAIEQGREDEFVPPSIAIEYQIAKIWEELLDIRPIGITDDFFALGGHSLLAVRMIDRVEQICGKRLPLASLFGTPTIAHLRDLLLQEAIGTGGRVPLIEVQRGGDQCPLFFLHGDFTGGGFYCRELARRLGPDRPFYALQPHGMDGGALPESIEAMACSFVEPLLALRPSGPILLAGYCAAGFVAVELARLLQARGRHVELVVMVSPPLLLKRRILILSTLLSRAGKMLGWSSDHQTAKYLRSWRYYTRVRAAMSGTLQPWNDRARQLLGCKVSSVESAGRGSAQARKAPQPVGAPPVNANSDMGARYTWVISRYRPRAYAGRVVVFQTSEVLAREARYARRQARRLRELVRHPEVRVIPGDHVTSITRYNAVLADAIRACLEMGRGAR